MHPLAYQVHFYSCKLKWDLKNPGCEVFPCGKYFLHWFWEKSDRDTHEDSCPKQDDAYLTLVKEYGTDSSEAMPKVY